MGWLIITIVFLVLGLFLVVIDNACDSCRSEVPGILGAFTTLVSISITSVLIWCMVSEETDTQITIDRYNNTVELIQDLGVPSEAIMTEIIKTNDKILEHRVKSNKFMTKGLYSKKVAALPLLEIPEVMKVSPIDYE